MKKKHIRECTDFKNVVFSDEKRYSLDGPDTMGSYFYRGNKSTKGPTRIKRKMGGGGAMILGAISSKGKFKIKIIEGKYTADKYIIDIEKVFIPLFRSQFRKNKWTWQQDN